MTKDQKRILRAFDKYKAELAEKMLKAWKCLSGYSAGCAQQWRQKVGQFCEIIYKRCRAAIITKKLVDNNRPAQITRILINAKLILMIMFILFPLCGL